MAESKEISDNLFLPILVGTDYNTYTMATSFYETYGKKSVVVGKLVLPSTEGSSFIEKIYYDDHLNEAESFMRMMKKMVEIYGDQYKNLILIGTNDVYVNLIIDHQDELRKDFKMNYTTPQIRDILFYKKNFYEYCEEKGIPIPKTKFYNTTSDNPVPTNFVYPVVVKASNLMEYHAKELSKLHKIYFLESEQDLFETIEYLTKGGYRDELVIQEYIPGLDSQMWDSVYYADSKGNPQLITLAQVLLQEPESHLIGSYTALVTRYNKNLMEKLANFLQELNFKGFANFDIKLDPRDNTYKVFEVNIRQGRSSSYIDFNGYPLAEFFVDDLIFNQPKPMTYLNTEFLYTVVPPYTVRKYITDPKLKKEISRLARSGKVGNPLHSKQDKGSKRRLRMFLWRMNYHNKYRKYKQVDQRFKR